MLPVLGCFLGLGHAFAQEVVRYDGRDVYVLSSSEPAPSIVPEEESNSADELPVESGEDSNSDKLFRKYEEQAGPLGPPRLFSATEMVVFMRIGVTYDDNILLSSIGPQRSDVITSLTGGASFSVGNFKERARTYAVISYAGTGELFAQHSEEDDYNQNALLDLYYRRNQLAVGSTSTFQESHDATADLGERLDQRIYDEHFKIADYLSNFLTLSSELEYEYETYDDPIDTSTLSLELAVDYGFASKVTLGAGVAFGRLTATGGLDEYSVQGLGRLSYSVTHKLKLVSALGIEYRDRGGDAGETVTPVFSFEAEWTPHPNTTFSLEAHRRTEASGALNGEDFLDTGFQLGVSQTLLQKFHARLNVGYQNADYDDVTDSRSLPRNDNYFSARVELGVTFTKLLQVLAFYERREDNSTRADFSFTSDRAGAEMTVTF